MLALRGHSTHELRLKLRLRQWDSVPVEATLARLQAENWLNDAKFAEDYVAYRATQGFGAAKVAAELRQRGVAAALVPAALAVADWTAALKRAMRGRPVAQTRSALAREARFLYQRGFSSADVRAGTKQYRFDERGCDAE